MAAPPDGNARWSRRAVLDAGLGLAVLGTAGWMGKAAHAQADGKAPGHQSPAPPPEVQADLPGARLQGSGRLRFFGLHVYDARLWVGDGFDADRAWLQPLALELQYARALQGRRIAERSLLEMRRVGDVPEADAPRWLAQMQQAFPDVAARDRITGVHQPGGAARFHVNGRLRSEVRDGHFAQLFFAVWLSPRSSEPALRQALLGLPETP